MDIFKKAIFKTKNGKGFTLAELLIVVAIIAVLVAVSIPIFSGRLEKSREATDVANMRAAKAAAVTEYLSNETTGDRWYDADKGVLVAANKDINGYGKGTGKDGGTTYTDYNAKTTYTDQIIKVTISADGDATDAGNVDLAWVAAVK